MVANRFKFRWRLGCGSWELEAVAAGAAPVAADAAPVAEAPVAAGAAPVAAEPRIAYIAGGGPKRAVAPAPVAPAPVVDVDWP